jgi:hypothetical protein
MVAVDWRLFPLSIVVALWGTAGRFARARYLASTMRQIPISGARCPAGWTRLGSTPGVTVAPDGTIWTL